MEDRGAYKVRLDFIGLLPPEVTLQIALYLDLDQVSSCLFVSKRWYKLLSDLEPYWKHACSVFGLSRSVMEEFSARIGSTKSVVFAARRQKQVLVDSVHTCTTLTPGYPFNVHYICHYARHNTLVGTVYRDFRPCEIVLKAVDRMSITDLLTLVPKFSRVAQNRTCWAQILGSTLFHVTASGIWSVHDLSRNGHLVLQWRGEPIFDSDVRFAMCESCYMICTSKLVDSHNQLAYWDIRVVSPGKDPATNLSSSKQAHRPTVVKFKLGASVMPLKKSVTSKSSVLLFSSSTQTTSEGSCTKHSLLLQYADKVFTCRLLETVSELLDGKQVVLSYQPNSNFTLRNNQSHLPAHVLRNGGLSTEMVLSIDQDMIGLVFQGQLITWDRTTSKLISCVDINLNSYIHEQIQLISLGHVYSLVGLEFSSCLLLVLTLTGQVVREFRDFADNHSSLVSPYIEFLGVVQDSWLSDISSSPSGNLPTVIYWNKTNRAIEGISFGEKGAETVVEETPSNAAKSWWKIW